MQFRCDQVDVAYFTVGPVLETSVKVYNRSGAGNQPFCDLIAIIKDAIIDI